MIEHPKQHLLFRMFLMFLYVDDLLYSRQATKKVGGNKKTDGKTVVSQASFFLLF
jgi:hypothetical protein